MCYKTVEGAWVDVTVQTPFPDDLFIYPKGDGKVVIKGSQLKVQFVSLLLISLISSASKLPSQVEVERWEVDKALVSVSDWVFGSYRLILIW